MARKKNKKSKAKRQKFIAKISRDGKISKKEGRKAAKKGISLRKIQNRNVGDYRQAVRDYERTPTERRSSTRPTFEPLKIKRGAERADFARQMREYGGRTQQARRPRGGVHQDTKPSTDAPYQSPFAGRLSDLETKLQGYMDQPPPQDTSVQDAIDALNTTIAGFSFEQPDYSAEFDAMRIDQENYMRELAEREAAAERRRELAFRTSQENMARGGMQADFRIGARSPRDQMGTGGFKRRRRRRETVAQGIAPTNTAEARGINLAAIPRAPVGYSKV